MAFPLDFFNLPYHIVQRVTTSAAPGQAQQPVSLHDKRMKKEKQEKRTASRDLHLPVTPL